MKRIGAHFLVRYSTANHILNAITRLKPFFAWQEAPLMIQLVLYPGVAPPKLTDTVIGRVESNSASMRLRNERFFIDEQCLMRGRDTPPLFIKQHSSKDELPTGHGPASTLATHSILF